MVGTDFGGDPCAALVRRRACLRTEPPRIRIEEARAIVGWSFRRTGRRRAISGECNGFHGLGFETIPAAIDTAFDGDVVLVLPCNHGGVGFANVLIVVSVWGPSD